MSPGHQVEDRCSAPFVGATRRGQNSRRVRRSPIVRQTLRGEEMWTTRPKLPCSARIYRIAHMDTFLPPGSLALGSFLSPRPQAGRGDEHRSGVESPALAQRNQAVSQVPAFPSRAHGHQDCSSGHGSHSTWPRRVVRRPLAGLGMAALSGLSSWNAGAVRTRLK